MSNAIAVPVEGFLDNIGFLKDLSDILSLLKKPLDLDKIGDSLESVLSKLGLADLGTSLDDILDAVAAKKAARAVRPIAALLTMLLPRIGLEKYIKAVPHGAECLYEILIANSPSDSPILMGAGEDGVFRMIREGEGILGQAQAPLMGQDASENPQEMEINPLIVIQGVVWAIKLYKLIRDLRKK